MRVFSEPTYKRPLDLTMLLAAHIVLLPVWIALWTMIPLAIWIESGGPVFFHTDRIGKGGRVFRARKFRSMVPKANEHWPPITVPNDPRITRVGKFLRRTALDELPQLLSILKGDMSFVGPRAYNTDSHAMYSELDPRFDRRMRIKPGLTGLAAVYGSPGDPRHRLALDLVYIRNRSFWLDVKLLFMSVAIALSLGWERKQLPGKLRRINTKPVGDSSGG